MEVRETDEPQPGPHELLLRTLSTGICASDVHFMDHPDVGRDDSSGQSLYDENRDIILGHEFVGEVIGYGPGCSDQFPVGSRVTSISMRLVDGGPAIRIIGQHPEAQGSFAERIVVSEAFARPVPAGVPDDAIAVVDAFAVGEFYVEKSKIRPGVDPDRHWCRRSRTLGRGGIGGPECAPDSRFGSSGRPAGDWPDRSERTSSSMPTPRRHPLRPGRNAAHAAGIRKPPTVFECVGAAGLIQKLIDSCEPGTRIYAAGGWYTNDTINVTSASKKGLMIQFGGGPRTVDWDRTLEAVCTGTLDPLPSVGRVIALDDVPAALDEVQTGRGPAANRRTPERRRRPHGEPDHDVSRRPVGYWLGRPPGDPRHIGAP